MAVTRSTLTSGGSTTDATSYATASVTPTANEVVVVMVVNTKSTGVAVPSAVSGNGITYQLAASRVAGTRAVSVWWGIAASPTAGVVTVDFGAGNTQTGCTWDVQQTTGADTTAPVRQSRTGAATATTAALDSALAAFAASSLGLYVVSHAANEATAPDAGWTELQDLALASPSAATETATGTGSALSPAPTWTTNSAYAIVAVEIAAPVVSTGTVAMVV